jgi:ABC-2 type transport system permease protein
MSETFRAAFVIARRDFVAIVYSKAFIFFLLGPLLPVLVGFAAGNLGEQMARDVSRPSVAVALTKADSDKLLAARASLSKTFGDGYFADMKIVGDGAAEQIRPQDYLRKKADNFSVVVTMTKTKNSIRQLSSLPLLTLKKRSRALLKSMRLLSSMHLGEIYR